MVTSINWPSIRKLSIKVAKPLRGKKLKKSYRGPRKKKTPTVKILLIRTRICKKNMEDKRMKQQPLIWIFIC